MLCKMLGQNAVECDVTFHVYATRRQTQVVPGMEYRFPDVSIKPIYLYFLILVSVKVKTDKISAIGNWL